MKRKIAAVIAVLGLALVAGCDTTDAFADKCTSAHGTIMQDETSTTGVNTSGGVSISSVTVRLCIVDGDVVDMEVK